MLSEIFSCLCNEYSKNVFQRRNKTLLYYLTAVLKGPINKSRAQSSGILHIEEDP